MEMNPGVSLLAGVLHDRSKKGLEAESKPLLEFGSIEADYSLLTNTFPIPIPQSDYLVCRQLTLGPTGAVLAETQGGEGSHSHAGGDHTHSNGQHGGHEGGNGDHAHSGGTHGHAGDGEHGHTALVPEKMRQLLPGDRVLVGWIGNDAVVMDIILPAAELGG